MEGIFICAGIFKKIFYFEKKSFFFFFFNLIPLNIAS